jgi:hypothetical protein
MPGHRANCLPVWIDAASCRRLKCGACSLPAPLVDDGLVASACDVVSRENRGLGLAVERERGPQEQDVYIQRRRKRQVEDLPIRLVSLGRAARGFVYASQLHQQLRLPRIAAHDRLHRLDGSVREAGGDEGPREGGSCGRVFVGEKESPLKCIDRRGILRELHSHGAQVVPEAGVVGESAYQLCEIRLCHRQILRAKRIIRPRQYGVPVLALQARISRGNRLVTAACIVTLSGIDLRARD